MGTRDFDEPAVDSPGPGSHDGVEFPGRVMRTAFLFPLVLLAGCDSQDTLRETPGLAPVYFTLSGTVFDSVLGTPLAGLTIHVGDSTVVTSDAGTFRTTQQAGADLLVINDRRFERVALPIELDYHHTLSLRLKGTAPYVDRCEFRHDTVMARIMDLQGRKTMDRRSLSFLTAELGRQTIQKNAYQWLWTPLDRVAWSAAVILPDTSIGTVTWRLEDLDGNIRTSSCDRSTICTECRGPQ